MLPLFIIITIILWIIAFIYHMFLFMEYEDSALGDKEYPNWRYIIVFIGSLVPYWQWYLLYRKYHNNSKPFKPLNLIIYGIKKSIKFLLEKH